MRQDQVSATEAMVLVGYSFCPSSISLLHARTAVKSLLNKAIGLGSDQVCTCMQAEQDSLFHLLSPIGATLWP